ncbi:DUF4440 domain-containing protein [Okibacterium sp. HSC-33S16]|uniref:nuclear transport factor 2 family protein n=1 Tax=Okibacterium sp. HSC-33S16 TaxID=2910965 RepID=UPI0035A8CB30
MDFCSAIRDAELALLSSPVRRSPEQVRAMLHPDFVEIGRSGRRWTRDEIVAALAAAADGETPAVDEWEFVEISGDLTLATYLLRGEDGTSRHSSLWDTSSGSLVMRFHQGTVVPSQ